MYDRQNLNQTNYTVLEFSHVRLPHTLHQDEDAEEDGEEASYDAHHVVKLLHHIHVVNVANCDTNYFDRVRDSGPVRIFDAVESVEGGAILNAAGEADP